MELVLKKGVMDLMGEVVGQGLCTVCGACVGICPYLKVYREKIVMIDICGVKEGQCYDICPRTRTDYEFLNHRVFGAERDDFLLGTHRAIVNGRAADSEVRAAGQYGGTVSALARFALECSLADAAILARKSVKFPLLPEAMIATRPEQVALAAGSKYTACPSISLLDKALKAYRAPLVVGRACQVVATRKKQAVNTEAERIPLVIGLFCMWALNYRELEQFLSKQIDVCEVQKFDIPEGEFVALLNGGKRKNFSFEEVKQKRLSTCDLCYDFTSELADISVGSTELDNDWNTVIIRTERGERFWKDALEAGRVEEKSFREDRRALLRGAAAGKKGRTLNLLRERFGGKDKDAPLGYLKLSEKEMAGGYK